MRTSRREVWLVDLGYVAKTRPCVVRSIESLELDRALVTLIPFTTSPRGTRFEVLVAKAFLKTGALDAPNPVTIANAKLIRKFGELTTDELAEVENAVRFWLGL